MKETKPSTKAICTVLAICMSFIFGISVFAENCSIAAPETSNKTYIVNRKQYLEEAIVKLVQEGKLSKEKAEKILEYKRKKDDEFSRLTRDQKQQFKTQFKKGSLLRDLKQDGILTDAEVQAIREKLREMKDERLADGMQILVEKGVLKKEDIDNIRTYMVKVREERKVQIDKLKTMTPNERKEYFETIKKERKDIITRMVEDKIITEEQAKEIKKAIPELNRPRVRKPNQKKMQ